MSERGPLEAIADIEAWLAHGGETWRPLVCPTCGATVNHSAMTLHRQWHEDNAWTTR